MRKLLSVMLLATTFIVASCTKKTSSDSTVDSYLCRCFVTKATGVIDSVDARYNLVSRSYASASCVLLQTSLNIGPDTATCSLR